MRFHLKTPATLLAHAVIQEIQKGHRLNFLPDVFFEVVPPEAELLLVASRGPHGETDEDKGHRLAKILSVVSR